MKVPPLVLVLAAGEATRFARVPKQLLDIGGETILARLERQLEARGVPPASRFLVTHHAQLAEAWHGSLFDPPGHRWIVETLFSAVSLGPVGGRQAAVLLADTIYSRPVMDRIVKHGDKMAFFGHEREIFALSFSGWQRARLRRTLAVEVQQAEAGAIGKLRSLWWRWSGLDYGSQEVGGSGFVRVSDFTTDIDTAGQYEAFIGRVVVPGKLDDR